jgi:flagellar FliJ protein
VSAKPFRFRLERVREIREHAEDRAREELASSLGAQLRGQAMLQAAAELVDEAQAARRVGSVAGAVPALDLQSHQLWLERLQRQRADAELAVERARAEVDSRRAALVEARRRREALERLKDRKRQEHRADAERVEGALLDEIALNNHVRQMGLRA